MSIFASDLSGERLANLVRQIQQAGGDQWEENCHEFSKMCRKGMPEETKKVQQPLVDEIRRHWWNWVRTE